ncbi:nucleotidyltransferase family protein [Candidatus Woesearchaeota archaeon]|jgi:mannose-1-phosphate guanylyltransferase|nr:nucleotidyltransferase family protein [Candidatus Woesearchaeota archaeon]
MKNTKALLLSAGFGTRLKPLTDIWPKCLMPIQGRPLLEYWLVILNNLGINNVLVNTHYLSKYVEDFLKQPQFLDWVKPVYENRLLGTAGTIRNNMDYYKNSTILLAHSDNWTCCNFCDFLDYHHNHRPKSTVMTMMTFICPNPSTCGIVELSYDGIVVKFHEKVKNPPSELANAAVYLIEPEVVEWIKKYPKVTDFSSEVLPQFLGKIATWENKKIHRDIGTIESLIKAQMDECNFPMLSKNHLWQQNFLKNPIHDMLKNSSTIMCKLSGKSTLYQ